MRSAVKLVPKSQIACLAVTDTVRDAFDRLETRELFAAPLVDAQGRYIGMITEADLRRHVAAQRDRIVAFSTPVGRIARGSTNGAVVEREVGGLAERPWTHPFLPVVDDAGHLVGIVERELHARAA